MIGRTGNCFISIVIIGKLVQMVLFRLVSVTYEEPCEVKVSCTVLETSRSGDAPAEFNVVARSAEAKALGIKMGIPAFYIKEMIKRENIKVFSSNYTLYGDMSDRVMNTISSIVPEIEHYSIDECFLGLEGYKQFPALVQQVRRTVAKHTGIPVSIGVGHTKTLAKIANMIAKSSLTHQGMYTLTGGKLLEEVLRCVDIAEIWGIGARYAEMLHSFGIRNALDLRDAPEHWIKSTMSVVGQRIWYELHGVSCLPLEQVIPAKKGICSSRSFAADVTEYETLKEAVSSHAARCAEKLRKQKSEASLLCVFISANRFALQSKVAGNANGQSAGNQVQPKWNKPAKASQTIKLPEATSNSSLLIQYALKALEAIYDGGQSYKKAGVYVSGIAPESAHQHTLFATTDREKQQKVMAVMDEINQKMGKNTLKLAAMGFQKPGLTYRGRLSPRYTTRWDELMVINCL